MDTRTLGGHLEVSAEGWGCMGMSEFYGTVDEAEATALVRRRAFPVNYQIGRATFAVDCCGPPELWVSRLTRWRPGADRSAWGLSTTSRRLCIDSSCVRRAGDVPDPEGPRASGSRLPSVSDLPVTCGCCSR